MADKRYTVNVYVPDTDKKSGLRKLGRTAIIGAPDISEATRKAFDLLAKVEGRTESVAKIVIAVERPKKAAAKDADPFA